MIKTRAGTVRSIGSDSWKLAVTETKIYLLIHIIIVTAIIFAGLGVCLRGLATKYYYDTPYPFDSYSHGNHYSVRCTTHPKYSYIANTILAFGLLWVHQLILVYNSLKAMKHSYLFTLMMGSTMSNYVWNYLHFTFKEVICGQDEDRMGHRRRRTSLVLRSESSKDQHARGWGVYGDSWTGLETCSAVEELIEECPLALTGNDNAHHLDPESCAKMDSPFVHEIKSSGKDTVGSSGEVIADLSMKPEHALPDAVEQY